MVIWGPLETDRQTHMTKDITFLQLRLRAVINKYDEIDQLEILYYLLKGICETFFLTANFFFHKEF